MTSTTGVFSTAADVTDLLAFDLPFADADVVGADDFCASVNGTVLLGVEQVAFESAEGSGAAAAAEDPSRVTTGSRGG